MNEVPTTNSGASKSKNYSPWIVLIILITFLCIPVLFFGSFLVMPAETIYKADEGFKKAKRTINPEELRSWALEEVKKYADTNTSIPESEIPKYIQNLYPDPPEFTEVGRDTVSVFWGGGFFHWKIDIGSTNFVSTTDENFPKVFLWCPGIYYTRESTWGLW